MKVLFGITLMCICLATNLRVAEDSKGWLRAFALATAVISAALMFHWIAELP